MHRGDGCDGGGCEGVCIEWVGVRECDGVY